MNIQQKMRIWHKKCAKLHISHIKYTKVTRKYLFYSHFIGDDFIYYEIYDIYSSLKKLQTRDASDEDTYRLLLAIIERICFIEDYYKKLGSDEFPCYKEDAHGNINQITKSKFRDGHKNEIAINNRFNTDINNKSKKYVEDIMIYIHCAFLGFKPKDLWSGIRLEESPDRYFWKSRSKNNEDHSIRYLINVMKHCYSFREIVRTNVNAIVYIRWYLVKIRDICIESIEKYYSSIL